MLRSKGLPGGIAVQACDNTPREDSNSFFVQEISLLGVQQSSRVFRLSSLSSGRQRVLDGQCRWLFQRIR